MDQALRVLVGDSAKGLSAATVSRLKRQWADEYRQWRQQPLDKDQWVYLWVDGIYSGLRSEDTKLCALVVIGVNAYGQKRFLAIEDGVRESTQSWREVLLGLKQRGLTQPPKLAIGDGAMGFWAALDEVYPETKHQRCCLHKSNNVVNYLPKSAQPKAREGLREIWQAEDKAAAEKAFSAFIERYQAKYPKAVRCLEKDKASLLTFYDFPAEHWQSIRTTNPIESSFATIRHRSRKAKGCLSRATMLEMLYKLGESAEKSWRKLRGFKRLGEVIRGVRFTDGISEHEQDQNVA